MTVVHNARKSGPTCSDPLDCAGIALSTHTAGTATVVTATGEIDAYNVDRLFDYMASTLPSRRPLVLDLSKLSFFGAAGLQALISFGEECAKAGIDWALVAGHPVRRLLRIGVLADRLPTVPSVPEAVQRLHGLQRSSKPTRRLLQLVPKPSEGARE